MSTNETSDGSSIHSMQQQLSELTNFVCKMIVGNNTTQTTQVKACGICTSVEHPTDACPTLHEDVMVNVSATGYTVNGRPTYDPFSNTYNPSWRDHPNFRYGNPRQQSHAAQESGAPQQKQSPHQYEHVQAWCSR